MADLTEQQKARIVELARYTETKRREASRLFDMAGLSVGQRCLVAAKQAAADSRDASAEAFRIAQEGQ
jgi:hypothetical protein